MATQRNQASTAKKDEPKDDVKAEEKASPATAPKGEENTEAKKSGLSYGEQAASLAADTRALTERIREDLGKLTDRISGINETAPTADDVLVADGIRRVPMVIEEVHRALAALDVAAADLSRAAAR